MKKSKSSSTLPSLETRAQREKSFRAPLRATSVIVKKTSSISNDNNDSNKQLDTDSDTSNSFQDLTSHRLRVLDLESKKLSKSSDDIIMSNNNKLLLLEEVRNSRNISKRRRHKKKHPFSHTPEARESLLEKISTSSRDPLTILQAEDLQGLVNLGVLILVAATLQLVLSNYFKHGFLLDFVFLSCLVTDLQPAFWLWLFMNIFAFSTFIIQKCRVRKLMDEVTALTWHFVFLGFLMFVPTVVIFALRMSPLVSGPLAMNMCVLLMKMHSFFATNTILAKNYNDISSEDDEQDETDKFHTYPHNVTISNFTYFLCAPTLVYEVHYPRTERIRYLYVVKELMQMVGCFLIDYILFVQFILPVIKEGKNFIGYDMLRLTIPSIIIWLLGFYGFFHCFLNANSELLRFADRQFYLDWWNAQSLDVFWRKWNLLVHEWLLRHIYLESIQTGKASKKAAISFTFGISALMHEVGLSFVPIFTLQVVFMLAFQIVRPWFFFGMFLQVPLIVISRWLVTILPKESAARWGNVFVWASLFFGQPMIEILYIREWFFHNSDFFCVERSHWEASQWFSFLNYIKEKF